jgi:F-type H+-transporting ATPase subunit b
MKILINLLIVLAPAVVFASAAEHGAGHHDIEVPKAVLYQAINISILIIALVYFTKNEIVSFFGSRKTAYLQAAQKAAFAREQAEKEFEDLKNKIASLDKTREEQLGKAQAHADDLKNQIIDEADQVTKRIRAEAELTAKLEIQRAQQQLRHQLLSDSIAAAHNVLSKDIGSADQQKLQKEFINHIEVVR